MIDSTRISDHIAVTVDATEPRQTPPPPGRRFAEALETGVRMLVREAGEAAESLPGGVILAAARRERLAPDRGPGPLAGGDRPEGPGGDLTGAAGEEGSLVDDYWKLQQESQAFNLQFLQLQEELGRENRRFTTLSNVLKARHETSKAVIQNIR